MLARGSPSLFSKTLHRYGDSLDLLRVKLKPFFFLTRAEHIGSAMSRIFIACSCQVTHIYTNVGHKSLKYKMTWEK